ncbi:type III secretion system export apparatus subunit SctR [Endozoicomonas sp. SM1973]|uniref:Type III secretion system export apparatus subunit SctR n=1 Tax=Spartinivicinus marinus TaxID=2994442 RepID=A0A853HX58_9GAMM|nr:type III secretion system export apparatus subunit SctR [Spartinivicinus marinus]MCX4024645.1 type III secretion system export apparatus subunit SctR [Spartinivicinus marinus]NYZ66330.1 type III secretion system export apparatus subunit SctR [Spartinivicinus marinus]
MTLPEPFTLVVVLGLVSLIPFIAVMATSFVKLAVVFSLLRNALGIQQIPPNMALYGLALILTLYIMAPVGFAIHDHFIENPINLEDKQAISKIVDSGLNPYREFLLEHSDESERTFFKDAAANLWPDNYSERLSEDSLLILMPAFTLSELTDAFKMGFLLYLPFIAIDLIISNILLAMGMMMVSPVTISLPFKLLLFVLLDGWTRLTHGLVLSY